MSWKRREFIRSAAGIAGAALLPGFDVSAGGMTAEIRGRAFGTNWRVILPVGNDIAAIAADIRNLLGALEATMSPFRGDSELSRLNAANRPMTLSDPLSDVVREGLRIANLTDGAFDPTVGPVVARFGFGPIRGMDNENHKAGGYRGLRIDARTVSKRWSGLTFDPCGIGKGYALDTVGRLLAGRGIDAFFLEFGGEILVRGRHPTGRPWRLGIEEPTPGSVRLRHTLPMEEGALATSSDRVNAYVVNGRRYSHIIDPRTANPVRRGVASVSVIAQSAMTADALATALMVMGPVQGIAFAEHRSIPALFVLHDGDGFRDAATASFVAAVNSEERENVKRCWLNS